MHCELHKEKKFSFTSTVSSLQIQPPFRNATAEEYNKFFPLSVFKGTIKCSSFSSGIM